MNSVLTELSRRGLIAHATELDALSAHLDAGPVTAYVGFDPTAPSIHMGNLVQLMPQRALQRAGHQPILLVGGSTGLIGDPKQSIYGFRGADIYSYLQARRATAGRHRHPGRLAERLHRLRRLHRCLRSGHGQDELPARTDPLFNGKRSDHALFIAGNHQTGGSATSHHLYDDPLAADGRNSLRGGDSRLLS